MIENKNHPIDPAGVPGAPGAEAAEELHPILRFIVDHVKKIGIALGVLLLAVALYGGVEYWQQSRLNAAQERLGEIMVMQDPAQKLEQLLAYQEDCPEQFQTRVAMELAELQYAQEQYAEAAASWAKLAGSDDISLRVVGAMGQAKGLVMSGDAAGAVDVLVGITDQAPKAFYYPLQRQIALAAESAGNWERALDAYQELLRQSAEQEKGYYQRKVAEMNAKLGGETTNG